MTAAVATSRPPTQGGSTRDAVTALTVFVIVLVGIPSSLIVGPLGSAGTPAQIIGMGLFGAWALHLIYAGRVAAPRQSIRIMFYVFVVGVFLSYIAANLRPMLPEEARSADAGLLLVCAWAGIMLTAMDRISSRERLDVLLRRITIAAAALATLGMLQFVTKQPLTNFIQIPGLKTNGASEGLFLRDGLTRPSGTAIHPIEYGAVLTMSLPFALHYAFTDAWRTPLRRWYPVVVISAAILVSISRSAIVSGLVVLCFMVPTWNKSVRRRAYLALLALLGAGYVTTPGLLGTMTHLFTGISGDSSAQSRTGSYSLAIEFFKREPLIGRGFQTFLPAYRIFDNQYLGLLVQTGVLGLAAFLGLLIAGVKGGLATRRGSPAGADAALGTAMAASIASALVSFALFDAFSFPMATSLLFLILGCAGALRRVITPSSSGSALISDGRPALCTGSARTLDPLGRPI